MDYFNNALNYITNTLNSIKSGILTTKDILVSIGNIIGTIAEILGFIGFRVAILLITTAFVVWLLNLVSPMSRKTNYFIAVALVLWMAITAKMPLQVVVLKYSLIIMAPFVITYLANAAVKYSIIGYNLAISKLSLYYNRLNLTFSKKKKFVIEYDDSVGLLFTSDLPTKEEIKKSKDFLELLGYRTRILEGEKISLVDENDKIIFPSESKYMQMINSIKSKDIKLLWFWSQSYGVDSLLSKLSQTPAIRQNKLIVGNGDNSIILNYLQNKWNWKVIYGSNLKDYMLNYETFLNEKVDIENIFYRNYNLSLINSFTLNNDFILKGKMVGGDLAIMMNQVATANQMNFANRILFFDGTIGNKNTLYRIISHLKNFIVDNHIVPKAIVIGDLYIKDNSTISNIIKYFDESLKSQNVNIPFFKIDNPTFITLNQNYVIRHYGDEILLEVV